VTELSSTLNYSSQSLKLLLFTWITLGGLVMYLQEVMHS